MQWWCSATGEQWSWAWRWYPGVWLFMAVALVLAGAVRKRANALGAGLRAHPATIAGLVVLWLALDWPVGPLSAGYLSSAHALQFLLICFLATPLLLFGLRAPLAALPVLRSPFLRFATQPLLAALCFNVVVAFTHVPSVVDGWMTSKTGAFAIDVLWLAAGLQFWWPVLVRVPERPGFAVPMRILYLLLGTLFHTVIGVVLLSASFPIYGMYELAPPIIGWSAIADQQLAGGIMELGGATAIIGAASILFFRWANATSGQRRA
jgi:putative membrane protein